MQSARKVINFKKFMEKGGASKPLNHKSLSEPIEVVPLFEKINSIITSAITEQTEPKEQPEVKEEPTLVKQEAPKSVITPVKPVDKVKEYLPKEEPTSNTPSLLSVDSKAIYTEIQKYVELRMKNIEKMYQKIPEPGGGSVAKQFAAGGTMDGDLIVEGTFRSSRGTINPITVITADTTITNTSYTILASATTTNIALTLPSPVDNYGRLFNIKKVDNSIYNIILSGSNGDLIDGEESISITTQYETITLHSDGSSWWII